MKVIIRFPFFGGSWYNTIDTRLGRSTKYSSVCGSNEKDSFGPSHSDAALLDLTVRGICNHWSLRI